MMALSLVTESASIFASLVDTNALAKVVVASLAGAIGVTLATSLAIFGALRFADMRRDERTLEAAAFAVLAAAGTTVSVAAVVYGIVIMTSK
jgi:hypothetical protein